MADIATALLSNDAAARPAGDTEYDRSLRDFMAMIRKTKQSQLNQQVNGNSLLQLLDPARNSISYLFVLLARKSQKLTQETLFAITDFLVSFDPIQMRYAGPEWSQLIRWVNEIYVQSQDPQIILPIRTAILRMDPLSSTFTSNHLLLVRLCLEAGLPREALPILDMDIYCLPTDPITGIDDTLMCAAHELSCMYITRGSGISLEVQVAMLQEYYYLGAYVYIGLRLYERARLFLEMVITVPVQNHAVNPLMVEAHKRMILIGLLAQGQPYKTSHLVDQASYKTMQSLSKPYDALADAFYRRDVRKFNAETDAANAQWAEDGNTGIVNQVSESLLRYRVIDLQKTYAALPVDRVATHLSLPPQATSTLLTQMIRDGHVNATITHPSASTSTTNGHPPSPILRFQAQKTSQSDSEVDRQLQSQVRRIQELSAYLKEADRKVSITKEYADWIRRSKKTDHGTAAFEDPMDLTWGPSAGRGDADDEDMMADLS